MISLVLLAVFVAVTFARGARGCGDRPSWC